MRLPDRWPRLAATLGMLALALAAIGVVRLREWARMRLEAHVAALTGLRASLGGVGLTGAGLVMRDLRIWGAPPFDAELLARVPCVRIALGRTGDGAWWSPREIVIEDAAFHLLVAGGLTNLPDALPARLRQDSGTPRGRRGADWPPVRVVRGRFQAVLRPGRGPSVAIRTGAIEGVFSRAGGGEVQVEDFGADVMRVAHLAVRRLRVELPPGLEGAIVVRGTGGALAVPGGRALAADLAVDGWLARDRVALTVGSSRPPTSGRAAPAGIEGSFVADPRGARVSLSAGLALAPLAPLADRYGADVERARARLTLAAALGPDRAAVTFAGAVAVEGVGLRHPTLDRHPWTGMALGADLRGEFDLAQDKVSIEHGAIDVPGGTLLVDGWSTLSRGSRGRWRVRTPPGNPPACASLLDAQPSRVRDALAGLRLAGHLGVSASLAFDSAHWDGLALDVKLDPMCRASAEPRALSALLAALRKDGRPPVGGPIGPGPGSSPRFVPLGKLPRHLVAAFVTAEDGRFFDHRGFDLEMIRRALAYDLERGALAKGGSTITQQVAKNLFLAPDRTLARKLEEIVFAWRIERALDKARILELYLNTIELGPDIRGVEHAARAFFGKDLARLGPLESVHLAALAPNPRGYARRFREGRVDDGWLQRLHDLLAMMRRSGRLSDGELAAARAATLTLKKI